MPSNSSPREDSASQRRHVALAALGLVVVALLLYAGAADNGFVNYDDDRYVTENPHVRGGLTWSSVEWAFNAGYAANWHPLTWLSHMLDIELYGVDNPAGHHRTSVLLHAANTVLLFILLRCR